MTEDLTQSPGTFFKVSTAAASTMVVALIAALPLLAFTAAVLAVAAELVVAATFFPPPFIVASGWRLERGSSSVAVAMEAECEIGRASCRERVCLYV